MNVAAPAIRGPVLVAVGLPPDDEEALRQASTLAHGLGHELIAVHVVPELHRARMLFPHAHRGDDLDVQAMERRIGEAVAARVESATGRGRSAFRVALDSGSAHAGVLRQAEQAGAGVVVVPPAGWAAQIVRHAPCPVLVARPGRGSCVLAASDLSDPAVPAIRMAASEARRRGLALAVVHAVDFTPAIAATITGMPLMTLVPSAAEKLEVQQARLAELREALGALGAAGEAMVTEGPAASAVAASALDLHAELLVIGTRGRSGLARLALGSTAEALVDHAPCSVLVVRLAGNG